MEKLLTYEEVKALYIQHLLKNDIITSDELDYIKDSIEFILENGTDGIEENTTHFDVIDRTKDGRVIEFSVVEYTEPILDEDGDIEDYKILGYTVV